MRNFVMAVVFGLLALTNSNLPAGEGIASCGECGEGCGSTGGPCDSCCGIDWLSGDASLFDGINSHQSDVWKYSVGAQLRHRYMDESNRFRPPGPADSDYQLWRLTPFLKVEYDNLFEAYVQAIDASAFGYDPPLFPFIIDENRSDLLQAYVGIKLADIEGGGSLKYYYGRQFLKYGGQRLLSPLGWANTYRNFTGHRLAYSTDTWDIDGIHMNSVNGAAGGQVRPTSFDRADESRTISGIYSSYKGLENNTIDLYWLWSRENDPRANRQDGSRHTLGLRMAGSRPVKRCCETVGTWKWDVEGAWQFGEDSFLTGVNQDVNAGFVSALAGYTFNSVPWSPTVNGIFHWGSGDNDPTDGEINTVYTLYPLGHAYWGLIDNFSGQNLIDLGASATVKPTDKLSLLAAWHAFRLAETTDFMYNIGGAPFAMAPGERNLGTELDLVGTYAVSSNVNIQLGYFWFYYGDAVNNSAFARPDASQFYLQTTLTF